LFDLVFDIQGSSRGLVLIIPKGSVMLRILVNQPERAKKRWEEEGLTLVVVKANTFYIHHGYTMDSFDLAKKSCCRCKEFLKDIIECGDNAVHRR
jgi:hypothetical protein